MPRRFAVTLCALAGALAVSSHAWSATRLQRYAVIVGANAGGTDRPSLQFAISDAERFARVMTELGGIAAGDEILLRQPKLRDLADALDTLTRRIVDARRTGGPGIRTEIVFYYSGHADEKGLLLGNDRYSYLTLRERLDHIPADVRIAVLDACSSGAFTRVKSGRPRPAFLVDESTDMHGHAFLTSSAESEAAQESDRIRASYFTHYLVSGFRGAADTSGDGKVTLNEAYQFAFNETLGKTVDTRGGAQHPSYDISLSGTGDVVMTDVRETSATLVLGEELEGRFFIRTSSQELVVELYKPAGRKIELALEPGRYDVRIERAKGAVVAKADVPDGTRVTLDPRQFGVAAPAEPTQRRGHEPQRLAVAGRHRLELRSGMWRSGAPAVIASTGTLADDVFGGWMYTRYVREDLALTFGVDAFGVESGATVSRTSVGSGTVGGLYVPVGVRWNPFKGDLALRAIKPFLGFTVGPVVGYADGAFVNDGSAFSGAVSRATIGGHFGGGFDLHLARSFSVGVDIGYNAMADFSQPVGVHKNFNGVQLAIGVGWLFGKGYGE